MDWEEISSNDATSKGLISKINKCLIQLNSSKRTKQPTEKRAEDLNRHLSKEEVWMGIGTRKDTQHHWLLETCKSNMKHHLTPVRTAMTKE